MLRMLFIYNLRNDFVCGIGNFPIFIILFLEPLQKAKNGILALANLEIFVDASLGDVIISSMFA